MDQIERDLELIKFTVELTKTVHELAMNVRSVQEHKSLDGLINEAIVNRITDIRQSQQGDRLVLPDPIGDAVAILHLAINLTIKEMGVPKQPDQSTKLRTDKKVVYDYAIEKAVQKMRDASN